MENINRRAAHRGLGSTCGWGCGERLLARCGEGMRSHGREVAICCWPARNLRGASGWITRDSDEALPRSGAVHYAAPILRVADQPR